mmetsp:Transcript_4917/g.14644  ORF Transcript_4917/g.14644 Transcript_4917/m.14644 type:complete len:265 (+) Transcript_4917:2379-3173(+)
MFPSEILCRYSSSLNPACFQTLCKETPVGNSNSFPLTPSLSASNIICKDRMPSLESTFPSLKSTPVAARRSPRVSAPRLCKRLATADTKRRSPPMSVDTITYNGPCAWFERCDRPSCWIALSAAHGNSTVMCTRRLLFGTLLLACSEIPVEAASEMMATSLRPSINHLASRIFTLSISDANLSLLLSLPDASKLRWSSGVGGAANLGSYVSADSLPTECLTILARLPVISATFSTPPSLSIKSSKKFGGKASSSTRFKSASLTS